MKGQKAQKGTLKKVLHYIRPYWALVGLSVLLAAVTVAASLYIPILTGNAVDYIVGPGNVDFSGILRILVEIGVVIAVAALSQWVMSLINNRITYRVVRDIRNKAFQKIQILPLKYLDGHPTGEVVSRVIADVDQFADGLLMGFTQLFSGVLTIVGTLVFMLSVNVVITAVVVVITPVSLVVAAFIAKRTYDMFRLQSQVAGGADRLCGGDGPGPKGGAGLWPGAGLFGEVRRNQRAAAQVQPAGHFLLLHHQPLHPVCQLPGVHRRGHCGRFVGDWRRPFRGPALRLFKLRQPVHQAL